MDSKKELVNAFIAPAKQIWEKELGRTLDMMGAETVSYKFTTEDITAVIAFQGQVEGTVLYGFSKVTASCLAFATGIEDAIPIEHNRAAIRESLRYFLDRQDKAGADCLKLRKDGGRPIHRIGAH